MRELLKKCGSEVLEVADDCGWMPLHYAAHLSNVHVVQQFLKTNSSIAYIKDNEGMSALHISARNGHTCVLKKLLEQRPDICELLDKKDRTALHVAVESGKKKAVKILLDWMAFNDLLNEQDIEGNTALHLAAIHKHYRILTLMAKDSRVDKGVRNKSQMTVLEIVGSDEELGRFEKVCFRQHIA